MIFILSFALLSCLVKVGFIKKLNENVKYFNKKTYSLLVSNAAMSINPLADPLWPDLCYILTSYMLSKQNHITYHIAGNELLSACSGPQITG